jgi:hypothetical protein
MNDLLRITTDFASLGPLLAGLLTMVGTLAAVMLMVVNRRTDLSVKLTGSILVLAMSFAAQNGFVYAIGVFVIATLVTELQFLEKLAALIWNRKEYWDYLSKASPREVQEKIARDEAEIAEVLPRRSAPELNENNTDATDTTRDKTGGGPATASGYHFHRAVISALQSDLNPISALGIRSDVKIKDGGRDVIIDALIETSSTFYIVEIKAGSSPRLLNKAVAQVKRQIEELFPLLAARRFAAYPVRGIIIIPPNPDAPINVDGVPVLQFDMERKQFVNREAFQRYLANTFDLGG